MVDEQLDLPRGLVMAGGGRVGFAQRGPGDRQGVDRVGRAQGTDGLAGAGHQPSWGGARLLSSHAGRPRHGRGGTTWPSHLNIEGQRV
jgi:hypothetical protein